MTRRIMIPIETHNAGDKCSVNCPWMIHRDKPQGAFCALTGLEIPDFDRTDRCLTVERRLREKGGGDE